MTSAAPASASTLDFGRAFKFVFEDPDWIKKLLLGALFSLLSAVLVGTFFVAGYCLRLMRRTAAGEARPLPEWDDLGGLFVDGLRAVGLYLLHFLGAMIVPGMLVGVLALTASGSAGRQGSGAVNAVEALLVAGALAIYALSAVVGLALFLYIPAAFTRLAILGRFGAACDVGANLGFIRANLGNYGLALLLYILASLAAQFGFLLCCIGILPASFWALCVGSWALGEVARRDPQLRSALAVVPS